MRLSLRFILWLWLGLAVILVALMAGAYSKLHPEAFLSMLNREVQRNYPGSVLTVKDLSYSFKLDFSLRIKELLIRKDETHLGRIGEVEVRLPWWLLLFNRGSAQINLSNLDIYVKANNDPADLAKELEPLGGKINVIVPDYVIDASYTLRAKDITVRDPNDGRRFFSMSKLLVREFQYGKNSAFELNIPIRISHKNTHYQSELWLFGDLTPDPGSWALKYRGEFKTRESSEKLEFEDLVIDGSANMDPRRMIIKSSYDLTIENSPIGEGKFDFDHDKVALNAKFTKLPLIYLSLAGEEIRNPYWKGLDGTAEGDLKFNRSIGREKSTTLSGKLNFPGNFDVPNGSPVVGNWQLNFENGKWETSFLSPKHEISFYRRAVLNFKEGKIQQYGEEMGFSDVDLSIPMNVLENLGSLMDSSPQEYHSRSVSIKNCTLDGKVVNGLARTGILPDNRFYQVELKEGENSVNLNYQDKNGLHQLEAEFKQFTLTKHHRFMAPFLVMDAGILDGKIQGNWGEGWFDGEWVTKMKFSEVSFPEGHFFAFWSKISNVFDLDLLKSPNFILESSVKKKTVKVTGLTLDGPDPAVITGTLSPSGVKSNLSLNYPKNKKWKPVKKEAGFGLEPKEEL